MKIILVFLLGILIADITNAQCNQDDFYMVYQEPYVARSYGNPDWSYVQGIKHHSQNTYKNGYNQTKYYRCQKYTAYHTELCKKE